MLIGISVRIDSNPAMPPEDVSDTVDHFVAYYQQQIKWIEQLEVEYEGKRVPFAL